MDDSEDSYYFKDKKSRFIFINKRKAKKHGIKKLSEIRGKTDFDFMSEDSAKEIFEEEKSILQTGRPIIRKDELIKRCDGTKTWASVSKYPLYNRRGKIIGIWGMSRDITQKKLAEEALIKSEQRLLAAQKMARVGNWEIDLHTKIVWASNESLNIYGIKQASQYLPFERIQSIACKEYRKVLDKKYKNLIEKNEEYNVEFKINKLDSGKETYIHSMAVLVMDKEGKPTKIIGTIQDITERKKKEEQILYLSYHDQLTELYNRRFYEEELKRLDTKRNLPLTLIMVDVDFLKSINDKCGHSTGDKVLKKVAEILKNGCRSDDIIARIGGDEFVILLPKTDIVKTKQIIERIRKLSETEKIKDVAISISFGSNTKNIESENIKEIFKIAEDQMYKYKRSKIVKVENSEVNQIMQSLYKKNTREHLHSIRVSGICEAIAANMNFDYADIAQIKIAGLMHDIGKIEINREILNKPEKLNKNERDIIRKHSESGYRILNSVPEFSEIATYVLQHHERWDGTGYPKGLKGEEILQIARIIAVADSYDAMTTDRIYEDALDDEEAVEELQRCSGTQFDPCIVEIFIKKVLKIPKLQQ
jgi:diguanylate cyclase (GGDEF)-like protein/PAS domain S-box-containing protein/putative nucleotidyltransferase with HDIG domain